MDRGAEAADQVEDGSVDALGDGGVFEHGDVEGVDSEGGVEVAFDAAAHAFEDDEVGVGGGGVEIIGDGGEVDEGFAGAGGDDVDWKIGEGGLGLEDSWPPDFRVVDGHVVEAGAFVGGEDDTGAAMGEETHEGESAEEEVA